MLLARTLHMSFAYPGQDPLLSDLTLSVAHKQRVVLIGPNGAGKSTLLRMLAGDLPPTAGRVDWAAGLKLRWVRQSLERPDDPGSGGERRFRDIMDSLVADCDLILLDEPTNHLDQDHGEALARRLQNHGGALLVVTHDRAFGDRLAETTWLLDHGRVRVVPGTPSHVLELTAAEQAAAWAHHAASREEAARLQAAAARQAERARRAHRAAGHRSPYAEARAKRMDRQTQAMEKRVDRERARRPRPDLPPTPVHWRTVPAAAGPPVALHVRGLTIRRGHLDLQDWHRDVRRGDRLVIIGRNGAGKSTLLETLAGRRLPDAGEVRSAPGVVLAYAPQLTDEAPDVTVLDYLRRRGADPSTAQIFATGAGLTGGRLQLPVSRLSGGEQRRLAIVGALAAGAQVVFLDEPTLDLDMMARDAFYQFLPHIAATLVVATHDPLLVEALGAEPLDLDRLRGGRLPAAPPAVDAEDLRRRLQALAETPPPSGR